MYLNTLKIGICLLIMTISLGLSLTMPKSATSMLLASITIIVGTIPVSIARQKNKTDQF
jgi:uncharacterized membrane protein